MDRKTICDLLGISAPTLRKRFEEDEDLQAAFDQGKAQLKARLHRSLTHKALTEENTTMQIFMAKNHLGMSDKVESKQDVTFSGFSQLAREIAEGKAPTDEDED